ncbi:MAG: zinc-binding dehydrogenase, partial [Methanomicrobiaceae archaeon]|nr:zinc-binding dehydrogenase [Methanomicrobiaceae archaeon]
ENASWTGNPLRINIVEEIRKIEPPGLDVVFECCGQQEAADQALDLLKPGGKLIIVGIPEIDKWAFSVDDTRRREISIHFVRRQLDCVETALSLISKGIIDVSNMVTHRFPFADTHAAFDLVEGYRDGVMKAMIDF